MWLHWNLHFLSFYKGCFPESDFFVSDLENGTSTPAHDFCLEVLVIDEVLESWRARQAMWQENLRRTFKKKINSLLYIFPHPGLSPSLWCPPALLGTRETSTFLRPLCLFAMCTKTHECSFSPWSPVPPWLLFVCPLSGFVNDLFVYFLQGHMVSLGVTSKSHTVLVSTKPKILGIPAMAGYLLTGNVGLIFGFNAIFFWQRELQEYFKIVGRLVHQGFCHAFLAEKLWKG